ncbi:MAG: tRNA-dihydrouridine synthase [Nocardioides sp.]
MSPLVLGPLTVPTPVVLAPMAGITNAAYRRLCLEQMEAQGATGLFVCEMITSRGLVERDPTTLKMLVFDELETTRSVQLYGTDPSYVGKATEILCAEYGVAHVDLNFGCPVPKVTRKGGGGALPWKRGLLAEILTAAVAAAAPYDVPVTIKTRKGLDDDHLTYLDAGRIAQEAGCAAISLHGRTVAQAYSGQADWDAISRLVDHVEIPVLGNGDIWESGDALRMVDETGAAGVVVGRGCLGRPWLFRDLAAALAPSPEPSRSWVEPSPSWVEPSRSWVEPSPSWVEPSPSWVEPSPSWVEPVETHAPTLPTLGEVAMMMRRHAELLGEHMGEERGCKEFRKHVSWYLKGFRAGGELRHSLALVDSLAALDGLLAELDPAEPFPVAELGAPRGRQGSPRERVVLPEGWLDDTDGTQLRLTEETTETTGG